MRLVSERSLASHRPKLKKTVAEVWTRYGAKEGDEGILLDVGSDRSVGMAMDEASPDREQHDFEVKPDRPMLDVIQVMLDPFFQ